MNKFNVGDKVRIKEDLSKCEFGYTPYMDAYKGKNAIIVKVWSGGEIELDIDKRFWNWSENVLELIEENDNMNMKIEEGNRVNESDLKDSEISKEVEKKKEVENDNVKMKRIDYILNAKDNMQAILDETILDCNICPSSCEDCNGNCEFYYKKYLNEEIEVDKSKLKDTDVESITIGQALQSICDIPPQIKIDSDKIKEVNVDDENDPVNHPSHYTDTKIEVMDYIEDKGFNFALGNAVKYISRAGRKDKNKTIEDLEKAEWYLNREIERLKKLQGK